MNEEKQVLTTKGLMKILGIGRDKAYALMKSAGFPSIKIGKNYYVTLEKFYEWLDTYAGRTYAL